MKKVGGFGRFATLPLLTLAVIGCKPADDEAPAIPPQSYVFQGKIEPAYVGDWSAKDGSSHLNLDPSGKASITTVTKSVKGSASSTEEGKWLAGTGSLMFQYGTGAHPTTVKYVASLEGKNLVLQPPSTKLKTTYFKK